ncbi:MAG: DUF1847 domain-containing protein [Sulfolobales archaeon]|nr:DUF1847 domain-containing protein [Sulfolobales archaeon]
MKGPNCVYCRLKPCSREPQATKPNFCPMTTHPEVVNGSIGKYVGILEDLHRVASLVEKEGYCVWPRLREVVEFSRKLNLKRLGVAFCIGLSDEAEFVVKYLESKGFEVYSVCCKCGGFDKTLLGLNEDQKLKPYTHESICNPILQADLLNYVGTELNVVVGLCVGHDTIFMMNSKAPVTYLIVKDRVTGHNPAAAIYVKNYFRSRLDIT